VIQEEQETIWYLEDVRDLIELAPYTLYIPSPEVIAMLEPGHTVKLSFLWDDGEAEDDVIAEQLWVRITKIDGDDFRGELDSEPENIPELSPGDEIEFSTDHIIDTQLDDPISSTSEQYDVDCFVTARVFEDEQPVGALYRENPAEAGEVLDNFSGWNIMAGDEDDEYLDNPDNWRYVSLGSVLNIDDRFIDVLDAPFDSEFVYDPEQDSFVEVEDD